MRALAAPLLALVAWLPVAAEPLHDAAKAGDTKAVQSLLRDGAAVDSKGWNDATPLLVASLEGKPQVVELLVTEGADVSARNKPGLTPLHAAAYRGHREVVVILLDRGADVNDAENRFKITPLHAASEENHLAIVELLLAKGSDPNREEANGYTPLTRAGFREHRDVMKALKRHGGKCQPEELLGEHFYKLCQNP